MDEEKIKVEITNISEYRITRSMSRKISLERYGGNQYEMEEFFANHSGTLPADAEPAEIRKLTSKLSQRCKDDIFEDVFSRIKEIKAEAKQEQKQEPKQTGYPPKKPGKRATEGKMEVAMEQAPSADEIVEEEKDVPF